MPYCLIVPMRPCHAPPRCAAGRWSVEEEGKLLSLLLGKSKGGKEEEEEGEAPKRGRPPLKKAVSPQEVLLPG